MKAGVQQRKEKEGVRKRKEERLRERLVIQ